MLLIIHYFFVETKKYKNNFITILFRALYVVPQNWLLQNTIRHDSYYNEKWRCSRLAHEYTSFMLSRLWIWGSNLNRWPRKFSSIRSVCTCMRACVYLYIGTMVSVCVVPVNVASQPLPDGVCLVDPVLSRPLHIWAYCFCVIKTTADIGNRSYITCIEGDSFYHSRFYKSSSASWYCWSTSDQGRLVLLKTFKYTPVHEFNSFDHRRSFDSPSAIITAKFSIVLYSYYTLYSD